MKLSLAPNLDDFFVNALNQSLLLLCTVAINVLEPRAFKTESQYFSYPPGCCLQSHEILLNKGMKHQMRDATQAPQGMTLWIALLLWHYSILHFDYHPQFERNPGFISEFSRLY